MPLKHFRYLPCSCQVFPLRIWKKFTEFLRLTAKCPIQHRLGWLLLWQKWHHLHWCLFASSLLPASPYRRLITLYLTRWDWVMSAALCPTASLPFYSSALLFVLQMVLCCQLGWNFSIGCIGTAASAAVCLGQITLALRSSNDSSSTVLSPSAGSTQHGWDLWHWCCYSVWSEYSLSCRQIDDSIASITSG